MIGTDGASSRDPERLGRIIRDRRGALEMTQPELAERAGVSLAYVYMLEVGGLPHPGLEGLLRVARAVEAMRLVDLLEEVQRLRAESPLAPSVEETATEVAVRKFLREIRA